MAASGPEERDEEGGGIFADINITPLTDIFLVLLIIFMVTTTAITEAGRQEEGGFEVNLPSAGKGGQGAPPRDVAVAILADGRVVTGGKVVDETELVEAFKAARGRSPSTVVLVQADEGVAHGRVVKVMELAREHGLARLAIATRAERAP